MTLNKSISEIYLQNPNKTDLTKYNQIDIDASKILYKSKHYKLDLSGILSFKLDVLKNIVKFKGWLLLNGIENIDDKLVEILVLHSGTLCLNGIKEIKPEIYKMLIMHKGDLYLHGLNELPKECLKIKKQNEGVIRFNKKLSEESEIIEYLNVNKTYLINSSKKTITKEIASNFIANNIKSLDDYTNIERNAARYLALKKESELNLNGITSIDDETLAILTQFRCDNRYSEIEATKISRICIKLNNLIDVSENALINLFENFKGHQIELNSIKFITKKLAYSISKYRFAVYLNGINELNEEIAEILSKKEGVIGNNLLSLNGLKTLSINTAKCLSEFKGLLSIEGIEVIDNKIAKEIAKYKGLYKWNHPSLSFPKLTEINKEIANEFSSFPGNLNFDGIKMISKDVAEVISKWNCNYLSLDGIKQITPETLRILINHNLNFSIKNLKYLNTDLINIINQSNSKYTFYYIENISKEELELIDKKVDKNIFIYEVGNFSNDTLDLILNQKIKFKYIKSFFNNQTYQIIVDYIKLDRYNLQNVQIENRQDFFDDLIIYLYETNQIEIIDIINPTFYGHPYTFNSFTNVDERLMKIIMKIIKKYGKESSSLYLNNLKNISNEALEALKSETDNFSLSSIYLNGLIDLDLKGFEILSKCRTGQLYLNSITNLPNGAAAHLSNISGFFSPEIRTEKYIQIEQSIKKIELNGLHTIDNDFYVGFKNFDGTLNMNSIKELNKELLNLLSNCNEKLTLHLSGIKNLDDSEIKQLTTFKGRHLSLYGLEYISDQGIEYIAKMNFSTLIKNIVDTKIYLHPRFTKKINEIRAHLN